MAWTDGVDRATGTIITASIWNQFFGNSGNINLTAPYLAAAAGDLFQASGSKVLARLAKGTRNQYLQTNAAANAVEWSAVTNEDTLQGPLGVWGNGNTIT